jgi:RHS repeat-associated protein
LSVTDPLGRRTEYTYDSSGNTVGITYAAGTANALTASFTYEPVFNRLATVSDPLNHTTSFSYDSKGSLIGMTDPLGHQSAVAYNPAGQPISATDALGSTAHLAYDSGDFTTETDPLGHSTTGFTDAAGRKLSVTDSLGRTTRYEYDALSRPTLITDPMQAATSYVYDANSNLLSVTDARGKVHSYTYDNMDRMATHTDPLGRVESYQYDLAANLTQYTDRKGQITTYTYDSLDRMTQMTYQDASTTSYSYDAVSRLTQVVDSMSGTIAYAYDDFDRMTSKSTPQGTVSYAYDASGRRTSMTVPGRATINYTYDNADRLTQVTQGASTVVIAYDSADRRTSLTLPNGVATEYGYNEASQLTALTYKKSGVTIGNLSYEYDAVGKVSKLGGSFARAGLPQALTSTGYDSANRQTAFGSQILAYDNNGNLTSDGVNSYTWNARNELVGISGPGLGASFAYDASGKRTSRTVNGVATTYLYDGANVVQEQVGGSASANMLNGELDEVLVRTDSSGALSPIGDGLGSTIALTNATGALQTEYSYEPFGKATATGGASSNPMKYTGREDDGTGLYYYRARYYNPTLQRFISEDPIGFSGGVNFYTYVENDPVNGVDPYGLKTYVCCRPLIYRVWGFIPIPLTRHCYILVTPGNSAPSKNGTSRANPGGLGTTYGLNGEFNGDLQLPKQDFRYDRVSNGAKDCKPVNDSSPSKERKLDNAWDDRSFCKGCGENYNRAHGPNSNTYVSDVLGAAGMTPPGLPRSWVTPGYRGEGLARQLIGFFFGKK